MSFNRHKYDITRDYIPYGQSRSGYSIDGHIFLVAHDTGNGGSTAQGNVNWFHGNPVNASAHTFIDDVNIIEDIPLDEKAWHVRYNVNADNRRFGDDANDVAIGVELCYGGNIDFEEAYRKYVWYLAYLCDKYGINPKTNIVGHSDLDPGRKTDPQNALHRYGKTFAGLIRDIRKELAGSDPMDDGYIERGERGKAVEVAQKKLKTLGFYTLAIDGIYGPGSESAVLAFQKTNDLTVDGLYGSETAKAVDEQLIKRQEDENMANTGFKDVPKDHSLADEIKLAKELGITEGFEDGTFRPSENCTRAEALAFAIRAYKAARGGE